MIINYDNTEVKTREYKLPTMVTPQEKNITFVIYHIRMNEYHTNKVVNQNVSCVRTSSQTFEKINILIYTHDKVDSPSRRHTN